jgi:hypothetical protein
VAISGDPVKIEDIPKLAADLIKDYLLWILAVLKDLSTEYPDGRPVTGSADAVLTAKDGRTYVFAALNLIIGVSCFYWSLGTPQKISELPIHSIMAPIAFWVVIALGLHFFAKLAGSDEGFLTTLGVCLRTMPLALGIAGLLTLAIFAVLRPIWPSVQSRQTLAYLHIIYDVGILMIYVPVGMRRAHGFGQVYHWVLSWLIVVYGVVINLQLFWDNGIPLANKEPPQQECRPNVPLSGEMFRDILNDTGWLNLCDTAKSTRNVLKRLHVPTIDERQDRNQPLGPNLPTRFSEASE